MNDDQAKALLVGLVLIASCALFPPREYVGGTIDVNGSTIASRGFLFDRAIHKERTRFRQSRVDVDGERLLAQCVLVGTLTGAAVLWLRRSR